ncbi:unnamed protein product [Dibothriocephalus latus]|uniref:TUG ubiquitin-like domain-containing protein n=1 Tax=Dibothriocephalus latus TaxID=60516 RepID=A0A3P7LKV3_DIBLA|nr:unnamed protein product [Dibothriocephalus latus]
MSYLNVRYPTGHLEKIPVQPNAPLLRALEAACSKRSFDIQKCKLIYRKKALDLSVPFRLSGLLNHANVELVTSDEQTDESGGAGKSVRVCLRLEDGHRVEWVGSVSTCLWDILEALAASEPRIAQLMTPTETGLAPTLIYIQQQVRPLLRRARQRRPMYVPFFSIFPYPRRIKLPPICNLTTPPTPCCYSRQKAPICPPR